jgi:transposase
MKPTTQRKRGRPCKLTAERMKRIVKAISEGMTREGAAALGGISVRRLYEWREKFPAFDRAMSKADAAFEQRCIKAIAKAGQKTLTWTAAAWCLERRFPERYGKIDRVAIAALSPDARDPQVTISVEYEQRAIRAVCKALGADPDAPAPTKQVEAEIVSDHPALLPGDSSALKPDPHPALPQPAMPREATPEENPVVVHKPASPLRSESGGFAVVLRKPDRMRVIDESEPQRWKN